MAQAQGPSAAQLQLGLYISVQDPKRANAAPLGLSGFTLTTFLLSLINLGTKGIMTPNILVGTSLAYGGFIQLCAGMWSVQQTLGKPQ